MDLKLLIVLFIGTLAMMIPMIIQSKKYKFSLWKVIISALILTVTGTIGTKIMAFVEMGTLEGISFYGAVFFVPLAFLFVSLIFRLPYGCLLDICAPAECIMLVIMKVHCLISGCCMGRVLFLDSNGKFIRFPSPIVEMLNALLVFVILLVIFYKGKNRGLIYNYYLVLYGCTRFILNFFRAEWQEYDGGIIPMGTVWSVVAISFGLFAIITIKKGWREDNCKY